MKTEDAVRAFIDNRYLGLVSPSTIEAYEWALAKLHAVHSDELPTTAAEMMQVFSAQQQLSAESRKSLWRRLGTFWHWIADEYGCPNPMHGIPAPKHLRKLPRTLNSEEIDRLLTSIDSERDYTIFAVLLDTGIRVGELASMTHERLCDDGILISGKTGDRIVPVSFEVLELVSKQGNERGVWVSRTKHRSRLTGWGLKTLVRRRIRDAGFKPPKIGPHMLRHTFDVQYILNGGDVSTLMSIMGHSNIETTMLYAEMSATLVAQQHHKFSPMASRAAGLSLTRTRSRSLARQSGYPEIAAPSPCAFKESTAHNGRKSVVSKSRSSPSRNTTLAERSRRPYHRRCQILQME